MSRTLGPATIAVLTVFLTTSIIFAAQSPQKSQSAPVAADRVELVQRNAETGTPELVRGEFTVSAGATKAEKAIAFFTGRAATFQLNRPSEELTLLSERTDNLGYSHLRFQQVYNDVPVWSCQTMVHFKDDNTIYLVGGQTIPTPEISTTPVISDAVAEAAAIEQVKGRYAGFSLRAESELVIFPNDGDPRLARQVTVTSPNHGAVRWRVFIDAQSGEELYKFNDIHFDGPITAIGLAVDGNFYSFPAYDFGGTLQLVDATRSMFVAPASNLEGVVVTYDDFYSGGPISTDPNADTFWNDNSAQKAEVSGHFFAGLTYQYFLDHHGRDSYDDQGSTIIVNVHDPFYTNNAYWNGEAVNFADGDGVNFLPFSGDIDVVAHELTHGVTEYNGNGGLIYRNQSGALNESYSDVFGNMVDSADAAWLIGEDISLFIPGYLRNMADPTTRNDPGHMDDYLYLPIENDNGGVHSNSGIANHCAYLASDVHGLGRVTMEQIWYRTLTTYLTPNSSYYFWAGMTLQSAIDLFGDGSAEMIGIENALGDVGLGSTYPQPQSVSLGAAFGQMASQSVWMLNPGSTTDSVTVTYTARVAPSVSVSPSSVTVADGDSAEFVVTLDATGLGECDIGAGVDTLNFTVTGPFTTEIRVPVTFSVGFTAASEETASISTSCVDFRGSNTSNFDRLRRDGNDVMFDGSLLLGVRDLNDTTTYRDMLGVASIAPVDTIGGDVVNGPISFRIASEDARIQGVVTYSWSGHADSCEFIVAEYDLYNVCDTPLTVLAGWFGDFDVNSSGSNQAHYDTLDRLIYIRDNSDTRAAGFTMLSQAPRNLRAIHNPTQVWSGSFTDGVAYYEMAQTDNVDGTADDDWSIVMTFDQIQLGAGDTASFAAAQVYSNTGSGGLSGIVATAGAWWVSQQPTTCCNTDGIRGDADDDCTFGCVTVADLSFMVDFLFNDGSPPVCEDEANADGDCTFGCLTVADLSYLVDFLFNSASAPVACP